MNEGDKMTLRHLTVFCAVCEESSMTRAAEKLYMTQPAVSRMIGEIERHYQVKLFDRIDRQLYLTSTGRQMWEDGKNVLLAMEQMESRLKTQMVSPVLRVGCSLGIGMSFIQSYLDRYYQQYPDTKVHIWENHSSFIQEKVAVNELDLGVVEAAVQMDSLVAIPFRTDDMVAVCSPHHPLACYAKGISSRLLKLAELNQSGLCLAERGTGTRARLDQEAKRIGVELEPIWSTINFPHIIQQVLEGRAVTVLSRHLVQGRIDRGELIELETDFHIERTFHIIWHKNKYLPVNGRFFVSLWRE